MRPWKRSSKSISRERLYLLGLRDKESGLSFAGRVFIPDSEPKSHPVLWFLADFLILFITVLGLFLLMITGFSLEVYAGFYGILPAECLVAVLICRSRWKKWIKISTAFAILIMTVLILFFVQEGFLTGAQAFYVQLRTTLNRTYNEEYTAHMIVGNAMDSAIFLSFCGWLSALWLGFAVLEQENFMLVMLLMLPLLAGIALCGGGKNVIALFLLMFGLLGCWSQTRMIRHKRLWGGGNTALFAQNAERFQRLQKKNLLIVLLASVILTIPGFYLVRPMLSLRLRPAKRVAMEIQSAFLSKMLAVLPDISADQWNLEVKTIGGGVSDGQLQDVEGYHLQGVEELQLTVTEKPQETIYLKGYVGSRYTGSSWEPGYETSFDGAAMNWRIRENPRLYIQNLPFLRTAYVLDQMEKKSAQQEDTEAGDQSTQIQRLETDLEPAMIKVERLNANEGYTYVPYGVFLNDYYKVAGGDSYVDGQNVNDDSYYFYYREEMEELLKVWKDLENTGNVLDRVEESYRIFCHSNYMDVAEKLGEIQKRVNTVIKEEKFDPEFDMTHIIAWIRAFLAENYEYEEVLDILEENEDFLSTFLFEKKKGYSIHFASAAVELFRMFGIPARYVVGYEAPAAIFSVQPDGTYTAILQDDNSQAWTEIYIDGIGWMPVDVTPGMVGTLQEVGPGGERIQTYEYENNNLKMEEEETGTEEEEGTKLELVYGKLTEKVNRLLNRNFSVEEVVWGMNILLLILFLGILFAVICRKICNDFGFDPFRRRTRLQRLLGIFGAYYGYMERKGLPDKADSASWEFLSYASSYLIRHHKEQDIVPLSQMRDFIYASCFGDQQVEEKDIQRMRNLYWSLRKI